MFSSIKSVIYPSSDLEADKQFWAAVSGKQPYFDEPYYVGFNIDGCELGLDPNAAKEGITIPIGYWNVDGVEAAVQKFVENGASIHREPKDVGGGMMMATLKDTSGNLFGVIDNPNKEKS